MRLCAYIARITCLAAQKVTFNVLFLALVMADQYGKSAGTLQSTVYSHLNCRVHYQTLGRYCYVICYVSWRESKLQRMACKNVHKSPLEPY